MFEIEAKGVSVSGVDVTNMLIRVLQMEPEEFRSKMEMKFGIIYGGDPEKIEKRMAIVD